jgi:hypothetical protein
VPAHRPSRHVRGGLAAIVLSLALVPRAAAGQDTGQSSPGRPAPGPLAIQISCDACDVVHLVSAIPFVHAIWREGERVDVEILVRTRPATPDERGLATFTGRGRFEGMVRRVPFRLPAALGDAAAREALARVVRLAVIEFAADSADGPHLDVTFARAGAEGGGTAQQDQRDPWRYWVFRTGASAWLSGQSTTSDRSYDVSVSANRTTEDWKVRIAASRSLSTSSFELEDGEVIDSRLSDWTVNALVVRSVRARWAAGVTGAVTGSSFSNSERIIRLAPAIEFDVFPYRESSRRSLTIHYALGGAHYDYEDETIFGRLQESVAQHNVNVSLGLRQPWGQAGGSLQFTQQLQATDRTRTTLNGNISLRVVGALSVSASGSYSRIRDLFTLEKGEATDEEVLLRQRQLATGYRYSFSMGFSYAFGSLSNATVNPRFGG